MKKNFIIYLVLLVFLNTMHSYQLEAQLYSSRSKSNNVVYTPYFESINVHIDKDLYIAGDYLFFKLYLISSDTSADIQMSEYAYIVLRSSDGNIVKSAVKLEKGKSFGSIYIPDTLKSNVYQFLAYTNYMRNFEEKSFFHKNILIINRFDKLLKDFSVSDSVLNEHRIVKDDIIQYQNKVSNLKIELEKDSFNVREKIKIKIICDNPLFSHANSNISISVKEINPFIDSKSDPNSHLFESFLKEDSIRKNGNINSDPTIDFFPETKGIYLRGRVSNNDQSVKDECLYISTPDTAANLQYAFSDSQGNFQFLLNNYYLGKDLILKLRNNSSGKENVEIKIEDKYNLKSRFVPVLPKLTIEMKKYIFNCQDIMQIQKTYNSKKVVFRQDNINENISFPLVYKYPTAVVFPARFIPLNDFKEIAENILMGVKMTKEKSGYEIYIANFITKTYFNYQPEIFLDGVPIDNIGQIGGLTSNDIGRIAICNILKVKGMLNFTGVLSVFSSKNQINSIQFNKPFNKLKIEKLSEKATYETPIYEKSKNQDFSPDFRQLLYWNPNISLKPNEENKVEFYASDYLSEYLIEVHGYSGNGIPLVGYAKIKVYH